MNIPNAMRQIGQEMPVMVEMWKGRDCEAQKAAQQPVPQGRVVSTVVTEL